MGIDGFVNLSENGFAEDKRAFKVLRLNHPHGAHHNDVQRHSQYSSGQVKDLVVAVLVSGLYWELMPHR